jgi:hypothetical protein
MSNPRPIVLQASSKRFSCLGDRVRCPGPLAAERGKGLIEAGLGAGLLLDPRHLCHELVALQARELRRAGSGPVSLQPPALLVLVLVLAGYRAHLKATS